MSVLRPTCLIVIPTLNEARHIGSLLDRMMVEARTLGARIVVADGGSSDGTQDIVLATPGELWGMDPDNNGKLRWYAVGGRSDSMRSATSEMSTTGAIDKRASREALGMGGGASPVAMKNAIRMACHAISHGVNPHIEEAVKKYALTHA